ncbi:MAG: heavy-metal-associated domain-containing protein [Microbacterium sp.]
MTIEDRVDLGLKDSGGGCACCATSSADAEAAVADTDVTAEVLVSGMTCSHCVASVTVELSAIDGVDGVSVDLKPGGGSHVTIRSSIPISETAVEAAVEEAGYSLVSSS